MTGKKKVSEATGGDVVALLAMAAVEVVVVGLVASALWGWFVVPLGLPPIGWAHASGIAGLVSYCGPSKDVREFSLVDVGVAMLWRAMLYAGIGWALSAVM